MNVNEHFVDALKHTIYVQIVNALSIHVQIRKVDILRRMSTRN